MSEQRWRVRLWHGSRYTRIWEVFDPEGEFSGAFETWREAMRWATSPSYRLQYLLEHQ